MNHSVVQSIAEQCVGGGGPHNCYFTVWARLVAVTCSMRHVAFRMHFWHIITQLDVQF